MAGEQDELIDELNSQLLSIKESTEQIEAKGSGHLLDTLPTAIFTLTRALETALALGTLIESKGELLMFTNEELFTIREHT